MTERAEQEEERAAALKRNLQLVEDQHQQQLQGQEEQPDLVALSGEEPEKTEHDQQVGQDEDKILAIASQVDALREELDSKTDEVEDQSCELIVADCTMQAAVSAVEQLASNPVH